MFLTKASLKSQLRGGTGALASFLAGASASIGQSHHLVWSLFGDRSGQRPFLYRMTGATATSPILIASSVPPEDHHNLWDIEVKSHHLFDNLTVGDRIHWSLRVNACVKSKLGTGKSKSARHCIVDHALREKVPGTSLKLAQDLVPKWLQPRLESKYGLECRLEDMRVESYAKRQFGHGPRGGQPPVVVAMTDIIGAGVITDISAVRRAVSDGIGAAKSYGCGLLLLKRAG